jgi:hypothetical protein
MESEDGTWKIVGRSEPDQLGANRAGQASRARQNESETFAEAKIKVPMKCGWSCAGSEMFPDRAFCFVWKCCRGASAAPDSSLELSWPINLTVMLYLPVGTVGL